MKCLFCKNEMVGFHVCDASIQNMSLRPDGVERMGIVTYGENLPNTASTRLGAGVAKDDNVDVAPSG